MYRFTSELPKEEYDNFILNYSTVAYIKMIL